MICETFWKTAGERSWIEKPRYPQSHLLSLSSLPLALSLAVKAAAMHRESMRAYFVSPFGVLFKSLALGKDQSWPHRAPEA